MPFRNNGLHPEDITILFKFYYIFRIATKSSKKQIVGFCYVSGLLRWLTKVLEFYFSLLILAIAITVRLFNVKYPFSENGK